MNNLYPSDDTNDDLEEIEMQKFLTDIKDILLYYNTIKYFLFNFFYKILLS